MNTKIKKIQRERRKKRIRAKIFGISVKPRLSIFKSNRYITAQLIDDSRGATLLSGSTKTLKGKNMREKAKALGKNIGKAALEKEISLAVFDRGGYLYAGSVAAIADGAREAGLKF